MEKKRVVYTEEEAKNVCAEWQKILRLGDWEVELIFVHQMSMPESMGEIHYSMEHKKAIMKIVSSETYASEMWKEQNMLKTIIHELLHLHIGAYIPEGNDSRYTDMEASLNMIAWAMYSLCTE